ncbi:MAG TPA: non-homologous end-joining DNA ligase [Bryobacteraceae bacterium]|nr:non-homologous end-joining DNA ligase [Bryobacteraceae bacterium]
MAEVRAGGRSIPITHEDRILFPRDGITKGDVIEYYRQVAPAMVPHLKGRRLTMQRYPRGIDGESFFQKEISEYFPDWVHRVTVPKKGGTVTHAVCDNAASLVYLANQGCLTPHVGLARLPHLEHPDQMIFDLDPAEDDFEIVRSVAFSMKELLEDIKLKGFVKTTGSRGLHLVLPLDRVLEFNEVRSIARQIAEVLVARRPKDVTLEQLKADRKGRLFLDTNRNGTAQTAVPAFAVRARDGAPVAVPISWDELQDKRLNARTFHIRNAVAHLKTGNNPWTGMARAAKSLGPALDRLLKLPR